MAKLTFRRSDADGCDAADLARLGLGLERVARSPHGADPARMLAILFDLRPDAPHVLGDGRGVLPLARRVPDLHEQLVVREHLAWRAREEREQIELACGELYLRAAHADLPRRDVDLEVAEVEVGHRRGGGAAEHRTHASRELAWREGLHDVVVGAELETEHTIDLRDAAGEEDHGYAPSAADRRKHLEAAALRQVYVENHQARYSDRELVERARAVADDAHFEALAFEAVAYERTHDVVVVDDEHVIGLAELGRGARPRGRAGDHRVGQLLGWLCRHVDHHLVSRTSSEAPAQPSTPLRKSAGKRLNVPGGSRRSNSVRGVGVRGRGLRLRRTVAGIGAVAAVAAIVGWGTAGVANAGVTTFTMSPTTGTPGTVVHVSGTGCAPGLLASAGTDFVTVTATTLGPAFRAPVAANGSWQGTFTVPPGAVGSGAVVTAVCVSSSVQSLLTIYAPQTFTVAHDVSPPTVAPGTPVTAAPGTPDGGSPAPDATSPGNTGPRDAPNDPSLTLGPGISTTLPAVGARPGVAGSARKGARAGPAD